MDSVRFYECVFLGTTICILKQEDVESSEEDESVTFSRPMKAQGINQRRDSDKIVRMVPSVTVDLGKLTSQCVLEDECNLVLKLPRAAASQSDLINSLSKKVCISRL